MPALFLPGFPSAALSGSMDSDATLVYLAWVFSVQNCCASLQDVATDALTVDLLEDYEHGRMPNVD